MRTSSSRARRRSGVGAWLRRGHRWLGIAAVLFVVVLSATGIALNHGEAWQLDRRYVRWSWLLDAYGIHAPPVSASYAARDHRATLLGQRLYLDDQEIPSPSGSLRGLVVLPELLALATGEQLLVLTRDGRRVEALDLAPVLPGAVERLGRSGRRVVIDSGGTLFISDAGLTGIAPASKPLPGPVAWSVASPVPEKLQRALREQYRGKGLTLERLLLDLHSGRVIGTVGPVLLDAVAVILIVLGISGILLWLRGARRQSGNDR